MLRCLLFYTSTDSFHRDSSGKPWGRQNLKIDRLWKKIHWVTVFKLLNWHTPRLTSWSRKKPTTRNRSGRVAMALDLRIFEILLQNFFVSRSWNWRNDNTAKKYTVEVSSCQDKKNSWCHIWIFRDGGVSYWIVY